MAKPIYLKVEKKFNYPNQKLWDTVALGYGQVATYNPALKSSRYDSDLKQGIGTKRHCEFEPKGYIKEEIIEWDEAKSFTLEFTESSVPMGFMRSKFSFQPQDNHTILIQEFWYRMKPPMGWLSGMMKGRMKKTLDQGLEGLEQYLKDGKS